jgi:four helix bundle protein
MNTQFTKAPIFFRFEDLRIYHKAIDYVVWAHDSFQEHPSNPHNSFYKRFNSIAQQIPIYIAEGSAFNKIQFVEQLKLAKSSVRECLVLTSIAAKCNYISEDQETESRNQLMEMTKMLGALITSLQKNNDSNYDPQYEEESFHVKTW